MYFQNKQNYLNLLPSNMNDTVFDGMKIYDTTPEDLLKFPLLVVSGSNGSMITSGLGDFASEIYDSQGDLDGYLYGGQYNFSIIIEIVTKTTLEREVLSDIVTSALRFSIRRKMEAHGVLITDMQYGSEATLKYDSNLVYQVPINLTVWAEWYDAFKLLPIDNISTSMTVKEK
jgi:hypothetical protein